MNRMNAVTCGGIDTDFPGFDNAAIQQAIDYAQDIGCREVVLSAGVYLLRDSVHMRNHVSIKGSGIDKTILKKNASIQIRTEAFCGYGHREIVVCDSTPFRVGDGIYTKSDGYYGFQGTQTTIREIDGNTLYLADPLNSDVHSSSNGLVTTVFPMIKGVSCEDVTVSDLTLEGNSENNHFMEGCRGGAIYLIGCKDIFVCRVMIHDFRGEGFSYQQCRNIWIEDSACVNNRGNGLHPGSGTVGMVIRNCDISNNDRAGIHNCLRVSYQICENNRICDNGEEGIEIGHRDDYLQISNNIISGNGAEGIFFRMDDCPGMSGRYVSIHANQIHDNAKARGQGQIYAPSGLVGLQMSENAVGGEVSFRCEGNLTDSFLWDNKFRGDVVIKNGLEGKPIMFAPEDPIRKVDLADIPKNAYRHL